MCCTHTHDRRKYGISIHIYGEYRNKFVQGGPHATSETGQAGQVLTRVHNNYNEFPLIQYKDFDELFLLLQLVLVQKKQKIKNQIFKESTIKYLKDQIYVGSNIW